MYSTVDDYTEVSYNGGSIRFNTEMVIHDVDDLGVPP